MKAPISNYDLNRADMLVPGQLKFGKKLQDANGGTKKAAPKVSQPVIKHAYPKSGINLTQGM